MNTPGLKHNKARSLPMTPSHDHAPIAPPADRVAAIRLRFHPAVCCLAGLALVCACPAPAGIIVPPAVYTVGVGVSCDFNSLQPAIDAAANGDTIRLTVQVNWLNPAGFTITDKSLSVVGGYSDCDDTTPDPDQRSLTYTADSASTFTVSNGLAGERTVLLRHLIVRDGAGDADHGGGVDLAGDVWLRLNNVIVEGNAADHGAGIRIHGNPSSPRLRLEGGSRIGGPEPFVSANSATLNGGGIHCQDGGVIEWVDASIVFNNALSGGGIYMIACTLTMPAAPGEAFRLVELRGNRSVGSGGGLIALNNSSVTMSSAANRQVQVVGNQASDSGGGIYLNLSQLVAEGVKIEQNQAADNGGGLYTTGGATVDLHRGNPTGANCPDRDRCATLSRNSSQGNGGAVYLFGASTLDLRQVFVEANIAPNMPIVLASNGPTVILRDVQASGNIATNLGESELIFGSDATLDFRHVTTAHNDVDAVVRTIGASQITIHDSILWEPGASIFTGDGSETLDLSCNNASESDTIPGAQTHVPGFAAGDDPVHPLPILRLAPESANIDVCPDQPPPNPAFDALGQPRLVDVADVANLAGPLDRGAIEFQPPLFADGFED